MGARRPPLIECCDKLLSQLLLPTTCCLTCRSTFFGCTLFGCLASCSLTCWCTLFGCTLLGCLFGSRLASRSPLLGSALFGRSFFGCLTSGRLASRSPLLGSALFGRSLFCCLASGRLACRSPTLRRLTSGCLTCRGPLLGHFPGSGFTGRSLPFLCGCRHGCTSYGFFSYKLATIRFVTPQCEAAGFITTCSWV